MYAIHYDAAARTLHIVTEGFWSPAVTAAFIAEVRARGTALRLRHRPFVVLAAMMPRARKVTALPIAAVVASNLAKLQTERYLVGANCRTFLYLAAAKRWLAAAWAIVIASGAKQSSAS